MEKHVNDMYLLCPPTMGISVVYGRGDPCGRPGLLHDGIDEQLPGELVYL